MTNLYTLVNNLDAENLVQNKYIEKALESTFIVDARAASSVAPESIRSALVEAGYMLRAEAELSYAHDLLFYTPQGEYVFLNCSRMDYYVSVAGDNRRSVHAVRDEMLKRLPPIALEHEKVPVTFWSLKERHPIHRTRGIQVPSWSSISDNYSLRARDNLDALTKLQSVPASGEKLILFHGEPGTGKSHAIRMLLKEWSAWCAGDYIVDPERFFGHADYMLSVILDAYGEGQFAKVEFDARESDKKSHLIILEDTDEVLTADAKERQGQAVSRLLNLTDGLLGQGLELLVLITTNERIDKLHPAVTREGRCVADLEFGKLSAEESRIWCEKHGVPAEFKAATLAHLYSLTSSKKKISSKLQQPLGFAVSR